VNKYLETFASLSSKKENIGKLNIGKATQNNITFTSEHIYGGEDSSESFTPFREKISGSENDSVVRR